ncbi:carboxymuconolactone decarboxylase family protein, partial [Desulfovibrio sp. OttesenSCG-928-G15]|nr:carboxymuconolactone decarboxylase family protein [Desulfovibrio sp. OttesenSCG-928-G15]
MSITKISILLCFCLSAIVATVSAHAAQPASPELSPAQRGIIPIAGFAAQGNMPRLRTALNEGLDAGLTINEIKQVLVQMYAYCGFPRSLNALALFSDTVNERAQKGIRDTLGKEPSPFPPDGKTSLELGTEVQTKLVGAPVKGGLMDFAPDIDL